MPVEVPGYPFAPKITEARQIVEKVHGTYSIPSRLCIEAISAFQLVVAAWIDTRHNVRPKASSQPPRRLREEPESTLRSRYPPMRCCLLIWTDCSQSPSLSPSPTWDVFIAGSASAFRLGSLRGVHKQAI